ncbi:MAG: glycoside hydrolase family 5 protein [Bacteroidales bacterium]|nr:glycoside hydrolase family 5 protein [Bacteroidales bacterium]
MKWISIFLISGFSVMFSDTGCSTDYPDVNNDQTDNTPKPVVFNKAFLRNRNIGKGINFGNALEAPNEGDWGLRIRKSYIQAIKDAGFNSARFPICWSAHTSTEEPHTIDQNFLNRVDEIIAWCFERDLTVIITIHHFNELYDYPNSETYRDMIFSIWDQLTEHYSSYNHDKLIFELLNEPHNNLTAYQWNLLLVELLDVVRAKDTDRTVILDVPEWGYHGYITDLVIPEEEDNAIVSVRYYLPYQFTHQGAHWATGSEAWLGTTWTGTEYERSTVINDLTFVKDWATEHNRPITIGEFGAIIYADHTSRVTWTNFVTSKFKENGFSWSYFDFGVLFKVYNIDNNTWDEELKDAVLKN